jgi:hypothetical protein
VATTASEVKPLSKDCCKTVPSKIENTPAVTVHSDHFVTSPPDDTSDADFVTSAMEPPLNLDMLVAVDSAELAILRTVEFNVGEMESPLYRDPMAKSADPKYPLSRMDNFICENACEPQLWSWTDAYRSVSSSSSLWLSDVGVFFRLKSGNCGKD